MGNIVGQTYRSDLQRSMLHPWGQPTPTLRTKDCGRFAHYPFYDITSAGTTTTSPNGSWTEIFLRRRGIYVTGWGSVRHVPRSPDDQLLPRGRREGPTVSAAPRHRAHRPSDRSDGQLDYDGPQRQWTSVQRTLPEQVWPGTPTPGPTRRILPAPAAALRIAGLRLQRAPKAVRRSDPRNVVPPTCAAGTTPAIRLSAPFMARCASTTYRRSRPSPWKSAAERKL